MKIPFSSILYLISTFALSNAFATQEVSNSELARRINILSDEITSLKAYQMNISKNESIYGLSPSASKAYFIPRGLSIGGYGEIIYQQQAAKDQSNNTSKGVASAEALRYVLYIGYKFNDKWVLNSEIEIEHVNEVFNEFMYLDFLHDPAMNFRFGLMLLPVGFTNQLHEPVLFPSVARPQVETLIIPSTWRELGVGLFGARGKLNYKLYLVNGGNADDIKPSNFRGARKKGGAGDKADNQNASTGAVVIRADYNFNTQSSIGFSTYQGQASSVNSENLTTNLYEVHAQYKKHALRVRFLYAELNYANIDDWNKNNTAVIGTTAQVNLQSQMQGSYLEGMYNIWQGSGIASLSPFVRYERINLNSKFNKSDYSYNGALDFYTYRIGVAYMPVPRLVFKLDYGIVKNKVETGINELNLGLGFNF